MNDKQLPPLPAPKFPETIRGVPCITVTEHEHLMRTYALQARAQATQAEVTGERDELLGVVAALGSSLRRLTFAARTSGGTAGADAELTAACEHAEQVLTLRGIFDAMRPVQVPMTDDQWTDVLGSSGPDLLDLAKKWADNKVHVYQVVNEAEKIVKAAVLRGIAAQAKKEQA